MTIEHQRNFWVPHTINGKDIIMVLSTTQQAHKATPYNTPSKPPPPTKSIFYGTFGMGQSFGASAVRIFAPDSATARATARATMFQTFGEKWCSVYDSMQWAKLKEQKLSQPIIMELRASQFSNEEHLYIVCTGLYPENLSLSNIPM